MIRLPLYAEIVERWAFVSTGRIAFDRRGGRARGAVVALGDGTHRYRRAAKRNRAAVDEPVEIRRFETVVVATVDEKGDEPVIRLRRAGKAKAL